MNEDSLMNEHIEPQTNSIEGITDGKLLTVDGLRSYENVIKIVGIGGGGGNALQSMYRAGIPNVSYLAINTDVQDLQKMDVPNKLPIGMRVTGGLGAGDDPERARLAAEESAEDIRKALNDGRTKIVFLTAGMGGGTGTGVSPVVARIAKKELDLLTVAIVTIPFAREGERKIIKALNAVERLREDVDAILVINNEKIYSVYQGIPQSRALELANDTLVNAAKSVSDLIYRTGELNVDTNDVIKTLKDGGVAVISSGIGSGPNRLKDAIDAAIYSPLLNGNDIYRASRILTFFYVSHEHDLLTEEMAPLSALLASIDRNFDYIEGYGFDDSLGENVKFTILASGFDFSVTQKSVLQEYQEDNFTRQERVNKERKDKDLIRAYYGDKDLNLGSSFGPSRPFIFADHELDNEEIINILDNEPSIHRNHYELEMLRSNGNESRPKPFRDMLGSKTNIDELIKGSGEQKEEKPTLENNVIEF